MTRCAPRAMATEGRGAWRPLLRMSILLLLLPAYQAFLAPFASSRRFGLRTLRRAEENGPVGDWVECSIAYTPRVSMHHSRVEPRREDVYIFHKRQLKEDFGHLYAKLGFTIQGLIYDDIKTVCREPESLSGQCSDCFKFFFGGTIGFTGTTSPKYYDRPSVPVEECVGDTMQLHEEAISVEDKYRPDLSIWCMKEGLYQGN